MLQKAVLRGCTREEFEGLLARSGLRECAWCAGRLGLTLAHVCVLTRRADLLEALLAREDQLRTPPADPEEEEVPALVNIKNAAGWTPLQDAAACRWRAGVERLLPAHHAAGQRAFRARLGARCARLAAAPDASVAVAWAFRSPVVPLLGVLAPHDACRVTKARDCFRVDVRAPHAVALVAGGGVPGAARLAGTKSLLFCGASHPRTPGALLLVAWDARRFVYLSSAHRRVRLAHTAHAAAQFVQHAPLRVVLDRAADYPTATVVRGLFSGRPALDTVGSGRARWHAVQLRVAGIPMLYNTRVAKDVTPSGGHGALDEDESEEKDEEQKGTRGNSNSTSKTEAVLEEMTREQGFEVNSRGKSFQGSLWVTRHFPVSFDAYRAVLEVLASSDRQVETLAEFLDTVFPVAAQALAAAGLPADEDAAAKDAPKAGAVPRGRELFPVKVEVPVFPTVSAVVTVTDVSLDVPDFDETFVLGPDFKEGFT